MNKTSPQLTLGEYALCIVTALFLTIILIHPSVNKFFDRSRRPAQMGTACKSNLKNIGTALEMYSSDNSGLYPSSLSSLTPMYLKVLPTCSSSGTMNYAYMRDTDSKIYTTWCNGSYHTPMAPANFPEYDSIAGLHEK
ncbi:MAG: type II secretion system protein [Candidatus Xenobiia bacterium LiM19]